MLYFFSSPCFSSGAWTEFSCRQLSAAKKTKAKGITTTPGHPTATSVFICNICRWLNVLWAMNAVFGLARRRKRPHRIMGQRLFIVVISACLLLEAIPAQELHDLKQMPKPIALGSYRFLHCPIQRLLLANSYDRVRICLFHAAAALLRIGCWLHHSIGRFARFASAIRLSMSHQCPMRG